MNNQADRNPFKTLRDVLAALIGYPSNLGPVVARRLGG